MLSCREVVRHSGDYLDQQLPWHKRLELRLHLLMCHKCRGFMARLWRTIRLVRGLPREELPEEQARNIAGQVKRRSQQEQQEGHSQ